jgi:small GTP-binding protein
LIYVILLIDKQDGSIVTASRFYTTLTFSDDDIRDFLIGYRDVLNTEGLATDTPIFVGEHKVFYHPVDEEWLLLLVTDGRDEDRTIQYKVREGASRVSTALRGNSLGYIKDNLNDILGDLIFTRFKISFVGSGGVGKSTLLRLLFGKEPAPGGYVPTINVAVDSSETIQFATFLMTIWDFAGQAVFQDLWGFYFQGTDIIFLITDSSFRNVMQTKTLLRNIRKEAPAVPLLIIANKQDLPESMRGDKIKRLLGAPTFPMVATDKTRREEFIRLMLEVATKAVGIDLPDRPVSDMIVVRRRTEEIDKITEDAQTSRATADSGFEDVPFEETGTVTSDTVDVDSQSDSTPIDNATETQGETDTEVIPEEIPRPTSTQSKLLNLLFIVQKEGMFDLVYNLEYSDEIIDPYSVTSLISALDSFGGIDANPNEPDRTDAIETIEHEGNLIMVEKSRHFLIALTATNNNDEEVQRKTMASLLVDFEHQYNDIWEDWDGESNHFEPTVFELLTKFPLRPISFDYIVRKREAGKPLPLNNREVGSAVVQVTAGIEGSTSVGGLVRSIDLPRETVLGCLQILSAFGWVDFKVEVTEKTVLEKKGEVDEDTIKAYGQPVVKFVNFCDGNTSFEDAVRKVGVSINAMKFVAQKLVLEGVLEVVA